jgi:hypothetical protein
VVVIGKGSYDSQSRDLGGSIPFWISVKGELVNHSLSTILDASKELPYISGVPVYHCTRLVDKAVHYKEEASPSDLHVLNLTG